MLSKLWNYIYTKWSKEKKDKVDIKIVGYFAWIIHNGRISYEKYAIERQQANVELTNYYKLHTLSSHPLNEEQWKLSLDELATIFPQPKGNKNVD